MKIIIALVATVPFLAFAKTNSSTKNCFIKPCEIHGDFDGDGRDDIAELISGAKNQKGIEIKFADGKSAKVGAGQNVGNGGRSLDWMSSWTLHKGKFETGAGDTAAKPAPKGDLILLESESASGIVWWGDGKLHWSQQGD